MHSITFLNPKKGGLKLLCLGAHCDDIEIGCGGTILKFIEGYDIDQIMWVVFTSDELRREEAHPSAELFLQNVNEKDIRLFNFRDGYLPSVWNEVKNRFESLKSEFSPDMIFTHYRNDLHQDHRVINELTWNTFRDHLIFEYEIPKYDGDLGNPNLFVPLEDGLVKQKKEIILSCFQSQLNKQWLDDALLTSIMRIRGMECASESKFAEAFYNRKMIL
jgi:LmbE family N-acetylglucosaminyl deacetylase